MKRVGKKRIIIRNLILKDYFNNDKEDKFDKYTDTLLYLAARNEHVKNKIKPSIKKKKIILCDRFIDSTYAYQVYGKGIGSLFAKKNTVLDFENSGTCARLLISLIGKFILNNSTILRLISGLIIIFFSLQIIGIFNFKFLNI